MTTPWIRCCCTPPRSTKTRREGSKIPQLSRCLWDKMSAERSMAAQRGRNEQTPGLWNPAALLLPTCPMLPADLLPKMSHSRPTPLQLAVCWQASPCCCPHATELGSAPTGSGTHDEFPDEAVGVHGGTPPAHHHTLSFFLQGQLKVEGSIWY